MQSFRSLCSRMPCYCRHFKERRQSFPIQATAPACLGEAETLFQEKLRSADALLVYSARSKSRNSVKKTNSHSKTEKERMKFFA